MTDVSLFPDLIPAPLPEAVPVEKLSADRRRTLRQRADIQRRRHPLTGSRLADDPAATCGNCRFRVVFNYHDRSYPKCTYGDGMPYATHGAASDVRAWWPGCPDHEWGDSKLSPDAARSGPSSERRNGVTG